MGIRIDPGPIRIEPRSGSDTGSTRARPAVGSRSGIDRESTGVNPGSTWDRHTVGGRVGFDPGTTGIDPDSSLPGSIRADQALIRIDPGARADRPGIENGSTRDRFDVDQGSTGERPGSTGDWPGVGPDRSGVGADRPGIDPRSIRDPSQDRAGSLHRPAVDPQTAVGSGSTRHRLGIDQGSIGDRPGVDPDRPGIYPDPLGIKDRAEVDLQSAVDPGLTPGRPPDRPAVDSLVTVSARGRPGIDPRSTGIKCVDQGSITH